MNGLKSVITASLLAAPVLIIAQGPAAALTITEASTGPINILGTDYRVFFNQETNTDTSFNDVFGTGPVDLTFTTQAAATAAVEAIATAVPIIEWEPLSSSGFQGFRVPYAMTSRNYSYFTAVANSPASTPQFTFGSFTAGRNRSNNFSMVTFEEVTPVPTPAAVLPGLFGMGMAAIRKRKQEATEEA